MEPVVTEEIIARQPPEAQAVIRLLLARIAELEAENAKLRMRVAELEAKVDELQRQAKGTTPQNSSLPPSSQHPHARPQRPEPKSKKQRGGQPGHAKHQRPLIPTDQCNHVEPCKPEQCRRCGAKLSGSDPEPLRHQVWELPEIKPIVTEYQRHRLTCPACGETTTGKLPPGVPEGQSGPRLMALTALLMAYYRQSKRRTAEFLGTLLGQPCSAGLTVKIENQVTAAVRPSYEALAAELPKQTQLNIDETPTKEQNGKAWLWTFLRHEGVEPTNHAGERSLRHAVIWRKLSFGTQSASGSRFVETMLTVIET
ncbi:MAG: transposase, partial [Thermoguttaceae bacterium]|nr:transposase [Thermoguttaceae bacterium]